MKFEFHRDDPDISLHELCAHILSAILHILKELYENLVPEIAFRCSCPKHRAERTISNLCTLVDIKKLRFLCERRPVKLEEAQQVWIGEVSTFTTMQLLLILKRVLLSNSTACVTVSLTSEQRRLK